ncbi:hypothetical protein ACIBCN_37135 [Nocardia sp. NPDC051052]|uniref:hypothetical protein n=1 Tax=Nocardia sp. NPDC051052 TaxID=3364322 RepID=UPI00378D1F4A
MTDPGFSTWARQSSADSYRLARRSRRPISPVWRAIKTVFALLFLAVVVAVGTPIVLAVLHTVG